MSDDKIRMRLQKPEGGFEESKSSRRDLLRLFAAGTIIAPVAGGATARLIEPPKAELIVAPPKIIQPFYPRDIVDIEISFLMKDGTYRKLAAHPGEVPAFKFHSPGRGDNVTNASDVWRGRISTMIGVKDILSNADCSSLNAHLSLSIDDTGSPVSASRVADVWKRGTVE